MQISTYNREYQFWIEWGHIYSDSSSSSSITSLLFLVFETGLAFFKAGFDTPALDVGR